MLKVLLTIMLHPNKDLDLKDNINMKFILSCIHYEYQKCCAIERPSL